MTTPTARELVRTVLDNELLDLSAVSDAVTATIVLTDLLETAKKILRSPQTFRGPGMD